MVIIVCCPGSWGHVEGVGSISSRLHIWFSLRRVRASFRIHLHNLFEYMVMACASSVHWCVQITCMWTDFHWLMKDDGMIVARQLGKRGHSLRRRFNNLWIIFTQRWDDLQLCLWWQNQVPWARMWSFLFQVECQTWHFKNVDMFETFLSDNNKTLFLFCADARTAF